MRGCFLGREKNRSSALRCLRVDAGPKFWLTDRSFSELTVRAKSKEDVVSEFRIRTIQDAALRVIARKGMASATIAEIADEANIAKGTIYLYFRDRDELVEKTFETAISQLHERIEQAMAAG